MKTTYIDPLPAGTDWVNNWQVSAVYAQLALAVWFGSRADYAAGSRYARTVLLQVFYPDGNVKELCDRNCHHPQYTLTGRTYAAELARIQGNASLYEAGSQRIKVGWEKQEAALVHALDSCADCLAHPAVWPGIETDPRYYRSPKLAALCARGAPYSVPTDDTFAGFTSFTTCRAVR